MMTRKIAVLFLAVTFAATCLTTTTYAVQIIAGWDQNDNANVLAGDGFGFVPADFPQANDHGPAAATHDIANFDPETDINGLYNWVDSFSGTTDNDLAGAGSGGSFSFKGGTNSAPDVFDGNGSQSVFAVPTTGYDQIHVSWSQRGTSTGFTSRVFEYSTDGGTNWTDVGAYNHTDSTAASSGVLTATFKTVDLDLSSVAALNNNASAMFRITYSGATSSNGNNRWDNFYVVSVPEPASLLLLSLGGIALVTLRRRNK